MKKVSSHLFKLQIFEGAMASWPCLVICCISRMNFYPFTHGLYFIRGVWYNFTLHWCFLVSESLGPPDLENNLTKRPPSFWGSNPNWFKCRDRSKFRSEGAPSIDFQIFQDGAHIHPDPIRRDMRWWTPTAQKSNESFVADKFLSSLANFGEHFGSAEHSVTCVFFWGWECVFFWKMYIYTPESWKRHQQEKAPKRQPQTIDFWGSKCLLFWWFELVICIPIGSTYEWKGLVSLRGIPDSNPKPPTTPSHQALPFCLGPWWHFWYMCLLNSRLINFVVWPRLPAVNIYKYWVWPLPRSLYKSAFFLVFLSSVEKIRGKTRITTFSLVTPYKWPCK